MGIYYTGSSFLISACASRTDACSLHTLSKIAGASSTLHACACIKLLYLIFPHTM